MTEALSASKAGTWRTEFAGDRTITDHFTAAVFGVDPVLAAEGLPLSVYARAIHPEDRSTFYGKIDEVRRHGGLFVTEYRTCPAPGVVHWILARGAYWHDEKLGGVCGSGIVLDITESKRDGRLEERANFAILHPPEPALDRAAQHAIEAREAIDEMDEDPRELRTAVDALLFLIGRRLLRSQRARMN